MRLLTLVGIGFIAAAFVAIVPADALAQGCAMCKTALDGPMDPTTEAFNVSSLFLMATPYTVVGTLGLWMYLSARRGNHDPEHDTELDADKEMRS